MLQMILTYITLIFNFMVYQEPKHHQHKIYQPITHKKYLSSGKLLNSTGQLQNEGYSEKIFPEMNFESIHPKFYFKELNFLTIKKFDLFQIVSENHYCTIAYADLGYAQSFIIHTYDYQTKELASFQKDIFSNGIDLDEKSFFQEQNYELIQNGLQMIVKRQDDYLKVRIETEMQNIDITVQISKQINQIIAVFPLSEDKTCFMVGSKGHNLKLKGNMHVNNKKIELQNAQFAFDVGRGVFPYQTFYVWITGMGYVDELPISINLSAMNVQNPTFTDGAFFYNNTMIKLNSCEVLIGLSQQKIVTFQSQEFKNIGDIKVKFTAEKSERKDFNIILIRSDFERFWGVYEGEVIITNTITLKFKIKGFFEINKSRW